MFEGLFFLLFLLFSCFSLLCYFPWCGDYVLSLNLSSFCRYVVSFDFHLSSVVWRCWNALLVCSAGVMIFVGHYFDRSKQGDYLSSLLGVFLGVMFFLFVCGSWFSTFVFWEYLGCVSFLLVLFSLMSSSLRGSLLTLLVSRFGDAALFIVVAGAYWVFDHWSLDYLCIATLLVIVTKSAFYPLTFWLPEAMRAPTPVSSLVHSSTLVVAGIWFLLRFVERVEPLGWAILFGLSVSTVVVSALLSLVADDLKKLVALSTCNNIAWCVIVLMFGCPEAAVVQMMVHGVGKCALFVYLGDFIVGSSGSQSSVNLFSSFYGGNRFFSVWVLMSYIFCLCGLPALGIFFSKHTVFCILLVLGGYYQIVSLVIGLFLTSVYSFRLMILMLGRLGIQSSSFLTSFTAVGYYGVLCTFLGLMETWFLSSVEPDYEWGLIIGVIQLLGCVLGAFLGSVKLWYPRGISSLNYSDSLVNRVYECFLCLTEFVNCFVVRWEVLLLCSVSSVIARSVGGKVWSPWFIFIGGNVVVVIIWFFSS